MRFPPIADSEFDEDQRAMASQAQRTGPFQAFLRAPRLWTTLQHVRRYLAQESLLPVGEREIAILTIARHWNCSAAFAAHIPLAEKAGVDAARIALIRNGGGGAGDGPASDAETVCRELLGTGRVSDATFERVRSAIGERGIVELVGLIGFFTTICLTLNAAGQSDGDGFGLSGSL